MSNFADLGDLRLHYRDEGARDGPAVVFSHALGTDLTVWDAVIPLLPEGLRLIRYDMRGHGGSDCPAPPYTMGALVRDAERLLEHLNVENCVFVGLSIGGMIAQGLAVKRMELVRGLVLSNTAAKIGQPQMWQTRADAVRESGMEAVADVVLERWFSRAFRASPEGAVWRDRLLAQNPQGYAGCCGAIAGTDFYTPTSGLRLPTLGIAGSEDGSTPPDLVRETVELIPGAQFRLIRRAGHLPCVDQPRPYAEALGDFLRDIGHFSSLDN